MQRKQAFIYSESKEEEKKVNFKRKIKLNVKVQKVCMT